MWGQFRQVTEHKKHEKRDSSVCMHTVCLHACVSKQLYGLICLLSCISLSPCLCALLSPYAAQISHFFYYGIWHQCIFRNAAGFFWAAFFFLSSDRPSYFSAPLVRKQWLLEGVSCHILTNKQIWNELWGQGHSDRCGLSILIHHHHLLALFSHTHANTQTFLLSQRY